MADRVFRQANIHPTPSNKERRKHLAEFIEQNVNSYIFQLRDNFENEKKEFKKQQ